MINLNSPILKKWINNRYLNAASLYNIRETVLAKPSIRYTVLDDFFKEDALTTLVQKHSTLEFSELNDKYTHDGKELPYDSAVKFANTNDVGAELFFSQDWHSFCAYVTATDITHPCKTDIKLRYHKPFADGFWIHTDMKDRDIVAIAYFNNGWTHTDGGLLQLWMIDDCLGGSPYCVETPTGKMDFLENHHRIRTKTPGGGFPDNQVHDLILIDQVVPVYNRVFFCNFKHSLAYHSITPSKSKARTGFVQWIRGA